MIWLPPKKTEPTPNSFWQVQDTIDASTIQEFTKTCDRDDCEISARIHGETTLMAIRNYYDKEGRLITSDGNRCKVAVFCRKCGKGEYIDNRPNRN